MRERGNDNGVQLLVLQQLAEILELLARRFVALEHRYAAVLVHIASGGDDDIRPALFDRAERTQPAIGFILGAFTYHAGIHYNNIRIFRLGNGFIAQSF